MFQELPPQAIVQIVQEKDSFEPVLKQLAQEGFILFYNENIPLTEWLGNFYPVQVAYNGLVFSNSEAAFQAQKFIHHPDLMAQFADLSPEEAFRRARELKSFIRPDWMQVNVIAMKGVLQAKIEQNPFLARWLDATGQSLLVEHCPVKGRDVFWTDDHDGTGANMLGKVWMEIRAEMRNEPLIPVESHPGLKNYQLFLESLKN